MEILRAAGLDTGVIANRAEDLPASWARDGRASGRRGAERSGRVHRAPSAPTRPTDQPSADQPSADVPVRPDLTCGAGPLGGLHAALAWARERGDAGVFLLGCDLPLVPPALVARLATGFDAARPTVPASSGPLGIEPLCACYPVGLMAAAEKWLAAGRFGMGKFVRAHAPVVMSRAQLASIAGARHAFLNVNAPADLERAADLLGQRAEPD